MKTLFLLTNATAPMSGEVPPDLSDGYYESDAKTFQAYGSVSSATGAASIQIEASNDLVHWLPLGTPIALSLTPAEVTDGFAHSAAWRYVRARVVSISGSDAKVSVIVGL
jgi:hypothetical protein